MTEFQIYLTVAIFGAVILVIAFDLIDMTIAALAGTCAVILFGILDTSDIGKAMEIAAGPLALLFGGMVVASVLGSTGVFDRLGSICLRLTGGSGKRFLLLLVGLIAPICALLPNATTVILLAPIIIRVAKALNVDFVVPMILAALISNAAGLLTLVGDPATFLVGSSIGMSFGTYLRLVSPAGLLSVLVMVPLLPWLARDIWNHEADIKLRKERPIREPVFAVLALSVMVLMVVLFLFGEELPVPVVPPVVAILGATLALLVVYSLRIAPVEEVLREIDWRTLLFMGAIFCLVQGFIETQLLQGLALKLAEWFGSRFALVALVTLVTIGLLSTVLANTPVVAAALVMTKGYLVAVQAVPELAMAPGYSDWSAAILPLFVAMMFGGTLGGNATLIGASANIVSAGICAANGKRVTFMRFLRIGLPVTLVQLMVGALYVTFVLPRLL